MEKDRNYLIDFYNATSTEDDNGNGEIETYEHWLEKQLLNRINAYEKSCTENHLIETEKKDRLQKYNVIDTELKRAKNIHPTFPTDMFQQLAVMQEEAGEVTKAVLEYHYEGGTIEHVKEELVHTAAMCMRMLENLKPK